MCARARSRSVRRPCLHEYRDICGAMVEDGDLCKKHKDSQTARANSVLPGLLLARQIAEECSEGMFADGADEVHRVLEKEIAKQERVRK